MNQANLSRHDHQLIAEWVEPDSRVLDLGCGDGSLLKHLNQVKNTTGYGLELNPAMITKCIDKGVNVIQTNLDKGLVHFDTQSFDYVILSLTLQAMKQPDKLLNEMMRVGKRGIVSFPNFGFWKNRLQIGFSGKMPVSDDLPYKWYQTPNIHLCTLMDFETLCEQLTINIEESKAVNSNIEQGLGLKLFPNLFAEIAMYRFSKKDTN